jgi:alkylation response protein AidB-like acyl-CoA dehydrogenase
MNFALDDDLLALQRTARRFADDEMIPVAAEHDVTGEFPREIMRKAWELGLTNTFIPEEYGGVGLSVLGACVTVEEISRGCSGMTTSLISNDLGLTPIARMAHALRRRIQDPGLLSFGARCRFGRGGSSTACSKGWRRLHPERHEGLDHERR